MTDPHNAACTCPAHRHPDPKQHHPSCDGAQPCGWRARIPEFLRVPLHEIQAGTRMPERLFVAMAIGRAGLARYGRTWTVPEQRVVT